MDFTREPIVETVVTAKDGHRLVLRSSKNPGQEEFFVDAIEVVAFQSTCFYRCVERPKAFIVPASDYEILEVREPRLALKTPSLDNVMKSYPHSSSRGDSSGAGRAGSGSVSRSFDKEPQKEAASDRKEVDRKEAERRERISVTDLESKKEPAEVALDQGADAGADRDIAEEVSVDGSKQTQSLPGSDRRRDRRRNVRRRRGGRSELLGAEEEGSAGEEAAQPQESQSAAIPAEPEQSQVAAPERRSKSRRAPAAEREGEGASVNVMPTPSSILPPPTTLIRDELARMRNNELYKGAFYSRDEEPAQLAAQPAVPPAAIEPQPEQKREALVEEERFIPASSLQMDDDSDVQVHAYTAVPSSRKKSATTQDSPQ